MCLSLSLCSQYLEMLWFQIKKMRDNEWKASTVSKWCSVLEGAVIRCSTNVIQTIAVSFLQERVLLRPYVAFDSEIGGAYSVNYTHLIPPGSSHTHRKKQNNKSVRESLRMRQKLTWIVCYTVHV